MFNLAFHTLVVLFFNLLWLYQRKWGGFKEVYGFSDKPYDEIQKKLTKILWVYSLSGLLTLILLLYKIFIL